jgi:Domain of unknown function (DUF6438)
MDENPKSNISVGRDRFLFGLHEIFFSANIACALAYGLAVYAARSATAWTPQTDSGYYFLRGVVRVSDLLHLGAMSAVSTDAVARRSSILSNRFAIEATFLASLSSVAALALLALRAYPGRGVILRRAAGPVALFAAPACCLFVLKLTWRWATDVSSPTPFGPSFLYSVFAGELLGFLILYLVGRFRAVSAGTCAVLLVLHFSFWCWVLFPNPLTYLRGALALYFLHLAVGLLPSAGAAWLLYVKPGRSSTTAYVGRGRVGRWTLVPALLGLAALLAIWLPSKGYPLTRPKDLKSAVVELSRGPCFGVCPDYTITIHGDGAVEYMGRRFVKVMGRRTSAIDSEEPARILQRLDQIRFSTLDDRAFSWCFDTPSVSIAVSLDGKTKRVASDAGCTGAKLGVQTEFVRAADDIDKIVGSDRWVQCDGQCRN